MIVSIILDDQSRSEAVPHRNGGALKQRMEDVYCVGKNRCYYTFVSPAPKKVLYIAYSKILWKTQWNQGRLIAFL